MTTEKLAVALQEILRGYDMIDDLDHNVLHIHSITWNLGLQHIAAGIQMIAEDDAMLDYVNTEVEKVNKARRSR